MGILTDVTFLARFQFAMTVFFHFLFVPLSIGLGLFLAISETKYYRSGDPKDAALTKFLAKIFTATFLIGVATGITEEFAFGTNWANYARFVGDIFGAPLAAEALFAFFLESVFLGIVLFGRKKVGRKAYLASTWLVWAGSALSALWILIANSWMQTPDGYQLVTTAAGDKAAITNFWAAALNPSTLPRYLHTVDSLLILGSFCIMAIGAYYLLRKRPGLKKVSVQGAPVGAPLSEERAAAETAWGKTLLKTGFIVGIITVVLMLPFGDLQAKEVATQQPAKLAAMEGQWQDGPANMTLFGYVDESTQQTYAVDVPIKGFVSWLVTGNANTVYPGLDTMNQGSNDLSQQYSGVDETSYQGGIPPVNMTFQVYHLMIIMWGVMIIWLIIAGFVLGRKKSFKGGKVKKYLLIFGPIIPFLAIQSGWMVTEIGRQPWVVYNLMLTQDGISQTVNAPQLWITIILFIVFYVVLFVAWLRIVLRFIKKGPVLEDVSATTGAWSAGATDGITDGGNAAAPNAAAATTNKEGE